MTTYKAQPNASNEKVPTIGVIYDKFNTKPPHLVSQLVIIS
jgi:hypothetical protein